MYFEQITKQIVGDLAPDLSPTAQSKVIDWSKQHGYDLEPKQLAIGQLMQYIVESDNKKGLLQILVVWARTGGELVDMLWDFVSDIVEDKPEEVIKRRPRQSLWR